MRTKRAKASQPPDPPMKRHRGSVRWFESGPEPILNDPAVATLIVQIGMASNAMNAIMRMSKVVAHRRLSAAKVRDSLTLLVTETSFLREAVELARKQMPRLRPFAVFIGMSPSRIDRVLDLCIGKHKAGSPLRHARNKVGFHWDRDAIHPAVVSFGRNKKLIWLESDAEDHPVYRLSFDVMVHALFPDVANQSNPEMAKAEVSRAFAEIGDAIELITEFFTACVYGYMKQNGVTRRKWGDGKGSKQASR